LVRGHQQVPVRDDRHPPEEQLRDAAGSGVRRLRRKQAVQADGKTDHERIQYQVNFKLEF